MRMTFATIGLIAATLAAPFAVSSTASAQGADVYVGGNGAGVRFRDNDRGWDHDRGYHRGWGDRTVIREGGPRVVYRRGGDCRMIIQRRENRWGETVVRRTRVCD